MSYQFYRKPVVLTLAVGSSDGAARQTASVIAGRLATTNSAIRLKVENAGTGVDAARAFAAGTADLAIVRADAGNLHDCRAVAVTARGLVDRYSNVIYLTPMVLGALASIFAAAWRFLEAGLAELFAGDDGASPGQMEEGSVLERWPV